MEDGHWIDPLLRVSHDLLAAALACAWLSLMVLFVRAAITVTYRWWRWFPLAPALAERGRVLHEMLTAERCRRQRRWVGHAFMWLSIAAMLWGGLLLARAGLT